MVNLDITIRYDDKLFEAIKFCSYEYVTDKSKINLKTKYSFKDKNNTIFNQLQNDTKYIVNYENITFEIIIESIGEPISLEGVSNIHNNMKIKVFNDNMNFEETNKICNKFYNLMIDTYQKDIMDKKKLKNKTTIYIWDDYWDTIEKRIGRSLDTIYLDGREYDIYEKIKKFKSPENNEKHFRLGIPLKFNIMLHGYPGTGKTSLIYALASELNMGIALLHFTKNISDSDFLRALRRLPEDTILVLEDIDVLFEARKKNDDQKNNITFSGLLNALDGIGHIDNLIIMMTTNCFMVLDSALTRPGRIDLNIEFKYSNKNQIKTMYDKFLINEKNNFNDFYKKIKHLKLTTAVLQQFFFAHIDDDNILEYVEELELLANENNYDNKKEILYT